MTDLLGSDKKPPSRPVCWLIAGLVFAVFLRSLHGELLNWDDTLYLHIFESMEPGWDRLKLAFTSYGLGRFSPLSWAIIGLNHTLWGRDPFGYHLTGVLLHCANAVVFYFLCRRLLTARVGNSEDLTEASLAAALSALFFALHPLRVEPVAWVTGFNTPLSVLFFQSALLSYIVSRRAGDAPLLRREGLPLSLFLMSLIVKEMAVTLPLVLVLLDIYPLGRLPADPRKWFQSGNRRVLAEKLPYFALSLVFGAVALAFQVEVETSVPAFKAPGVDSLAAKLAYGLSFYPLKTLLPFGLAPVYQPPAGPGILNWHSFWNAAVFIAITAAAVIWRGRRPALTAAWAYYLLTVWPMLAGSVRTDMYWASDRYAYLVCLGFSALAGAWALPVLRSAGGTRRNSRIAFAGLALAVLAALTWRQQGIWLSTESLWRHTLSVDPEVAAARHHLGMALAGRGEHNEAAAQFREALRIKPDYPQAHNSLGRSLASLGRPAEAAAMYREALRVNPGDLEAYNGLGLSLTDLGRIEEAVDSYRELLRIKPDHSSAHNNLGFALASLGKTEEAIAQYREALRLRPAHYEAHNNLGAALARLGRAEEAAEHYREALRIRPDYPEAYNNLGAVLAGQGRMDEAMGHYREALRIRPDYPEAHNNLGVVLAGQGRTDEAVAHYLEALRLRPGYTQARDNLAIALSSAGAR